MARTAVRKVARDPPLRAIFRWTGRGEAVAGFQEPGARGQWRYAAPARATLSCVPACYVGVNTIPRIVFCHPSPLPRLLPLFLAHRREARSHDLDPAHGISHRQDRPRSRLATPIHTSRCPVHGPFSLHGEFARASDSYWCNRVLESVSGSFRFTCLTNV